MATFFTRSGAFAVGGLAMMFVHSVRAETPVPKPCVDTLDPIIYSPTSEQPYSPSLLPKGTNLHIPIGSTSLDEDAVIKGLTFEGTHSDGEPSFTGNFVSLTGDQNRIGAIIWELVPPPPAGLYDVRLSADRALVCDESAFKQIGQSAVWDFQIQVLDRTLDEILQGLQFHTDGLKERMSLQTEVQCCEAKPEFCEAGAPCAQCFNLRSTVSGTIGWDTPGSYYVPVNFGPPKSSARFTTSHGFCTTAHLGPTESGATRDVEVCVPDDITLVDPPVDAATLADLTRVPVSSCSNFDADGDDGHFLYVVQAPTENEAHALLDPDFVPASGGSSPFVPPPTDDARGCSIARWSARGAHPTYRLGSPLPPSLRSFVASASAVAPKPLSGTRRQHLASRTGPRAREYSVSTRRENKSELHLGACRLSSIHRPSLAELATAPLKLAGVMAVISAITPPFRRRTATAPLKRPVGRKHISGIQIVPSVAELHSKIAIEVAPPPPLLAIHADRPSLSPRDAREQVVWPISGEG